LSNTVAAVVVAGYDYLVVGDIVVVALVELER
jgi:hypothetical protein